MPPSLAKRAETADRRAKAIALRIAGHEWEDIAEQLGYASRGAAHTEVTRALKANKVAEAEQVENLRYVTGLRLDRLQAAMWPQAIKGDTRSADVCLKIIQQRCKLYGLEAPTQIALQHRVDLDGQLVAEAIDAALDALDLTQDQRTTALGAARERLLAADQSAGTMITDGDGTMPA